MFYQWAGGATVVLSSLCVIAQLAMMPIVMKRTENVRTIVESRMKTFKMREELFNGELKLANEHREHSIEKRNTMCSPGRPGQQGPDGKDGPPGEDGERGVRGEDARDIMAKEEEKCIECPAGEQGPVGPPGQQGLPGDKGDKGLPGSPSTDGLDGTLGDEGDIGSEGFPGKVGAKGWTGKSAAGGVGLPGPKGAPGPLGRTGSQGTRGTRNYVYGPPGPPGKDGTRGLDGIAGSLGERGAKGDTGEGGANAKFCPCPLEISLLHGAKPPGTKTVHEGLSPKSTSLNQQSYPPSAPPAPSSTERMPAKKETTSSINTPRTAEQIDMRFPEDMSSVQPQQFQQPTLLDEEKLEAELRSHFNRLTNNPVEMMEKMPLELENETRSINTSPESAAFQRAIHSSRQHEQPINNQGMEKKGERLSIGPSKVWTADTKGDVPSKTMRFGFSEQQNLKTKLENFEHMRPESAEFSLSDMQSNDELPATLGKRDQRPVQPSEPEVDLPRDHTEWRQQLVIERQDVLQEDVDNSLSDSPLSNTEDPSISYDTEPEGESFDYVETTTQQRQQRFKYVTKRPRRQ